MKKYLIAAVAAASFASPAMAEFRAEVHGGVDVISAEGEEEFGGVFGVGVGYDYNDPEKRSFAGIELNADLSTIRECEEDLLVVGDELCADFGRDLSVVFRGGVKPSPTSAVYILMGYSNLRAEAEFDDGAGTEVSDHTDLDGIRLGAGYQQDFSGNMYGKIEYRYTNYEADVSRHQGLIGVGLKF